MFDLPVVVVATIVDAVDFGSPIAVDETAPAGVAAGVAADVAADASAVASMDCLTRTPAFGDDSATSYSRPMDTPANYFVPYFPRSL